MILKHVLTSPSSALHEHAKGTRGGNAKIYGVKKIEPEHIAYTAMQAQSWFIISSVEKWSEQDGLFNYLDFYYRIIHVIRETKDRNWVNNLIQYYNEAIFGDSCGPVVSKGRVVIPEDGDDNLLEMECQFTEREAPVVEESRPPTPAPSQGAEEKENQPSPIIGNKHNLLASFRVTTDNSNSAVGSSKLDFVGTQVHNICQWIWEDMKQSKNVPVNKMLKEILMDCSKPGESFNEDAKTSLYTNDYMII